MLRVKVLFPTGVLYRWQESHCPKVIEEAVQQLAGTKAWGCRRRMEVPSDTDSVGLDPATLEAHPL